MTTTVKVLTYNMHRGRSAFRRRDICGEVAGILDFSSADVVCLQEVWQHQGFEVHQLEEHLCDERWPHRVFAKTVTFPRGSQGNAVVTQLPVRGWSLFDISVPKREPRGILHTVVERPGGGAFSIFNVHFGLLAHERRMQAKLLERYIDEHVEPGAPYVVAGDFNDWRRELGSFFERVLRAREVIAEIEGRSGRTYPSYLPLLPLDRIYFRNCELVDARIVRDRRCQALSDHLPVEATLAL